MSAPKLSAAVIGTGYIGEQHARVYTEHPLVELTALVDIDEDRVENVAAKYDVSAAGTDSANVLFKNQIDIVSIATPEEYHVTPTECALEAGCHVLLEKPIAATESDARRIGKLVDAAETSLMIGYLCRFNPRYEALKRAIETGEFGELRGIQAARIASQERYNDVVSWSHPVHYLSVHDIDAMRWYTESEVTRVYAVGSEGLGQFEMPSVIHATLEFQDDTVGVLETNWARSDHYPTLRTDEIRLTGTDGYGRLINDAPGDDGLLISSESGVRYPSTTDLHGKRNDFLRREIDHFVDCVLNDTSPLISWRDGLESLRVANAIKRSIKERRPIELFH